MPVTYFGPQPSSVQRELVGEYQNLKAGKIDLDKATITLPLYQGAMKSGQTVWYIVTDTDDKGNADQLGLDYSPKLTLLTSAGRFESDPGQEIQAGFRRRCGRFLAQAQRYPGRRSNLFPPKQFQPTGIGDKDYTPLVKITNAGDHIYNAPVVAYNVSADASINSVTAIRTIVSSIRRS